MTIDHNLISKDVVNNQQNKYMYKPPAFYEIIEDVNNIFSVVTRIELMGSRK